MLRIMRIFLIITIGQWCVSTPLVYAVSPLVAADDLVSPKISHNIIVSNIVAGSSHQIKAVVTDNVGIDLVLLFYRTVGSEAYRRVQMARVEGTDNYVFTLGYAETIEPGIEYYFQAIDYDGNSLLYGYSFSPLQLRVTNNSNQTSVGLAQTEGQNFPSVTKKTNDKISKWVWIGLGVLAVGAVATVRSSDGDSGSGASKPETGTIVISGPSPTSSP